MAKGTLASVGVWAFVIGFIIAILVSIFYAVNPPSWVFLLLAFLGLVVGVLNITDKEVSLFLLAALSFLVSFQALSKIIQELAFGWAGVATFFNLVSVFIAPAAAIVALQALYVISKD